MSAGGPWLQRRGWLALGAGLLAGRAAAQSAEAPADTPPAERGRRPRSLTLLVGGAAGGAGDTWARGFAPYLERQLPRAVLGVQDEPGDGGLAAARRLAESPPDARLLGAVSVPLLIARAVELHETALLGSLDWLAAVAEEPVVLVTAARPGADLAEFRALGEIATLGLPPPGSAAALFGDSWARLSPVTLVHFPSAAAARQAAQSGHVAAAAVTLPEAIQAIRDGRLDPLGLATSQRCDWLPEVPTFSEQGFALIARARRGFVLPPGVPARLRDRLAGALLAAVRDPEFVTRGTTAGFLPSYIGPEAWPAEIAAETARLERRWITDPWPMAGRG